MVCIDLDKEGVLIVSSIKSPYYVLFILYSCCFICLRTETINTPFIVHGYIDRMNPTVILLEERQEQLILADDEMPYESEEGMWVDIAIHKDYRSEERRVGKECSTYIPRALFVD